MTAIRVLASSAVLMFGLGIAGCAVSPSAAGPRARLAAPTRRPTALAILLDTASAADVAMLRSVLIATARPGERLVVISSTDGAVLGSFLAPQPAVTEVPGPPRAPKDATSFETASYRRAVSAHKAVVRRDRAAVGLRERRELEAWAAQSVAKVIAAIKQRPAALRHGHLAAAIDTAVTTIATWQQTGIQTGTRRVIAILGLGDLDGSLPAVHADLQGTTVVVARFPGGGQGAALQADLLRAGADRAVVLTAATDSQLAAVVDQGLDGTISYKLTHISYGSGQYRLPSAAKPTLTKVLNLLTTRYPGATATVNGYTDNIPIRGGNVALSWRRASAVMNWLIRHGVPASRLQAVGHGAADPVAPNLPGGQPLNRRVVIVIEPAA